MNDSQEAALIRRCQAGDQEAFRALVGQHRSLLFGTAYLMTHDRGLAEDAVQEALVQIWKHLPSFRPRGSVKAWLARIVVNEVKQQFRKKRVLTIPLNHTNELGNDPDETETAMMQSEERQYLQQALNMLPPQQRDVVILRYYSDLTVPEIAVTMGEREGTIKSRLSRALSSLSDILQADIPREDTR